MKEINTQKSAMGLFTGIYYDTRKKILLAFYIVSIIVFEFIVIVGLERVFGVKLVPLLFVGLVILIIGSIGGAYLSVLIDLPNISHEFDPIKNDIALKKISTPDEFGKRVLKLICSYFNFIFFNIEYSFCKLLETDYIYSHPEIIDRFDPGQYDMMLKKTQETENIVLFEKIEIEGKSYYLYLIPIWFGQQWLGFIGVYSPDKLRKIFLSFLSEFENNFIDDQLVHVLNYKGFLKY